MKKIIDPLIHPEKFTAYFAVACYRISHILWKWKLNWFSLWVMVIAKIVSGVVISPSAIIGRNFMISHGSGIVIGETAIIGNNVLMLQQVTLGVKTDKNWHCVFNDDRKHPKIEDDVLIGAGAKILGPITIGRGSRIGANAVVLKDVPAFSTAVGVPARIIKVDDE